MEPPDYQEDRVLLESQAVKETRADQDKRVNQDRQELPGNLEGKDHLDLQVLKDQKELKEKE